MKLLNLIQLRRDEEILEIVHESFVPHIPRFFLLGLWFLVPFFFLFPLFQMGTIGVVIFVVLLVSGTILFWRSYRRWAYTVFVITDQRIIDIDQKGFFDRVVTETTFYEIDEVSYRVKGVCATIFRYGFVRLQLAGSAADIEFDKIKRPARIHALINDLRNELHA